GLADDELVLGRAPGVLAGQDDQRPALRQLALAALQALLVECRHVEVPIGRAEILQAMLLEAVATDGLADVFQRTFLPLCPCGPSSPKRGLLADPVNRCRPCCSRGLQPAEK